MIFQVFNPYFTRNTIKLLNLLLLCHRISSYHDYTGNPYYFNHKM